MLDYKIPGCYDFISIFGCECTISDDFVQHLKFCDKENSNLDLYIGLYDNSVRVILTNNSLNKLNDIYFEDLNFFQLMKKIKY
ncbi:hypothetical protein BJI46_11980 [Acinetobacter qingfengensis]|uniref:Uncharacterized protein n=1 Tax=Acinetobacter qingfengensis TaxID=1262585 RepID=A0A1E7RC52_9GAMM|nr:hypothetical protein BJI46_11980 [Acinetobacter qingfengensis]